MSSFDEHITPGSGPGDSEQPLERISETMRDAHELDDYIEELKADVKPTRADPSSADGGAEYVMAALFRSATPGAAEPRPEFLERMRRQLAGETETPAQTAGPTASTKEPTPSVKRRATFSRRGFLGRGFGAAAAAAAVAAGVGAGVALDRITETSAPSGGVALVPLGDWVPVAAADAIPVGAVKRFTTDSIVGFVRHTPAGFEALSGTCTHMGCLLAWNGPARTFDCPCHGGRFNEDGTASPASSIPYQPLPHINVKVEAGQVLVYAPSDHPQDTSPESGTPYPSRG